MNEYNRVFGFITWHFIAPCSNDSVIIKSICRTQIRGEIFQLAVRQEPNWLDLFPFHPSTIARIPTPLPLLRGEVVTAKSIKMIARVAQGPLPHTDRTLSGPLRQNNHRTARYRAPPLRGKSDGVDGTLRGSSPYMFIYLCQIQSHCPFFDLGKS
jgi:hypothetical protein